MRPKRLEIEGLGPFRERVELDFGDCDLFAFTGATGSGKSSLVDAMVFALYGSVPRYGRRDVAPVVTQGTLQGKVRLDFSLGEHDYTVVRSVRLDAKRRVSTEARLERAGDVLAGTAPEVTAAIESLIGLDFSQFTKCVVLPQGEFDGFLRAQPADRQGLLIALLDLGIYDRVAELARIRQAGAEGEVAAIDRRLAAAVDVTPEAVKDVEHRLGVLDGLLRAVNAAAPRLEALAADGRAAKEEVARQSDRKTRLKAVREPSGLAGLAKRLDDLRGAITTSEAETEAAESSVLALEDSLAAHPDRAALDTAQDRWKRHERALEEMAGLSAGAARAAESLDKARMALERAQTDVDQLRREHEAEHIRSVLDVGDECPVCGRVIEHLSSGDGPGPLGGAEERLQSAVHAHREADRASAAAANALSTATKGLEELAASLGSSPQEIAADIARVKELSEALAATRAGRDQARKRAAAARKQLEDLAAAERDAKQQLQKSLLSVAGMDPPPLDLDDLTGAWGALVRWVTDTAPVVAAETESALRKADDVAAAAREINDGLLQAAGEAEVAVAAGTGIRDAVISALTAARSRREQLSSRLEEVRSLEEERATQAVKATVAKALAGHLRANNFEKWLLDEALRVLAGGANRRLSELARGQYSLTLNSRLDFEVIDHQAADERRSIQSLSGGETFLVSLALALSLADHIAEMSAVGTSRLEAIFLDEGFGTLDPESLEAVASVISEIGAGGKMVGIITHVKELAEMVPCRFEVRKDASSARVLRRDA